MRTEQGYEYWLCSGAARRTCSARGPCRSDSSARGAARADRDRLPPSGHGDAIAQLDLALDGRGNLAANDHDYRTSTDAVFACGDARRGQSLIVWAIRQGRQCAEAVDRSLRGDSDLPRV